MHFREQCFAAAMEVCSESEAAEVVHGWVPGGPGFVVHAWAEIEGAVYDFTESNKPERKADYYARMGVRPELTRRYTRVEYFTRMAETGSMGPFDKDLFFANETTVLAQAK